MDQLQLGLSLPLIPIQNSIKRNRLLQTLPLLSWNDKPDAPPPNDNAFSSIHNSSREDQERNNQGVGWPPIESWRKKALHGQHAQPSPHTTEENRRGHDNGGGAKSSFVKVKMEGIGIARKVDLELYESHHSLKKALLAMFSTYQPIDRKSWDFTLIYEDRDGDWLLAEDLPWNPFVESVQRLKILVRNRDRNRNRE